MSSILRNTESTTAVTTPSCVRRAVKVVAGAMLVLHLGACSLPMTTPPPQKKYVHFVLPPHGSASRGGSAPGGVLLVSDIPNSGRGGGRQIVFKRSVEHLAAYQNTAWSQPAAEQLHEYLVRRLRYSELFRGVSGTDAGVVGDYQLRVELYDFYLDLRGDRAQVVARIAAEAIELHSRKLLAQKQFEQIVPMSGDLSLSLVVDGFSSAAERLISVDIIPWLRDEVQFLPANAEQNR